MADAIHSPQILHEFVQNVLDDLVNGRITPDAAIVASQQYPYLRTLISERKDEIAGAIQDEGKLRVILEGALRIAATAINKELPQFQVEKPDQQLSPNDVVARARSFRAARLEVGAAIGQQHMNVGRLRKTFINRLVQNWIAQSRTVIDKDKQQQVADALKTELEQELLDGVSPNELVARVQQALVNTRVNKEIAAATLREVAPAQQELVVATQKLAGVAAIPKELVAHLNDSRPDRLATIAVQTVSSTTLSPSVALSRAASLAQTAEALTISLPKEKGVTAAGVFFRAFASGPTQKAFAAAADSLLHQLSPLARQEVIKATFSRALEGALVKTDLLTERLGREFVESDLFQLVVDGTRKEFARGAGEGAGTKQARGALEDVVGSILRGPVMEPLVGSPKEMILSYFELLAVEARLPRDKKVLFPDRAPVFSALSHLLKNQPTDTRVAILKDAGIASSFSLQTAVSAITQRLPSWQVFYVMMLASSAPTLYSSLVAPIIASTGGGISGGAPSSMFGPIGDAPISAVGGGLSAALGLVGRGLSGAAFGLGGGLIGMMFGGGLGSLFNKFRGPRQPEGFFDDTPKLIAVFIVVIIVILFVFPSFLNSSFTSRAAKYAALLVNSQPLKTGGPYTEELPPYDGPFPGGPTAVASCAVDHKHLSQGPFDKTWSHGGVCAYDFDAPWESEVRAVHDGYVVFVRTNIINNKFIDGSYGNYVLLAGTGPDGKPFYSVYAHLSYGSSSHLSKGQLVTAGAPLGEVDNTGDSTGTHLHLEFKDENQKALTEEGCFGSFSLPAQCLQ